MAKTKKAKVVKAKRKRADYAVVERSKPKPAVRKDTKMSSKDKKKKKDAEKTPERVVEEDMFDEEVLVGFDEAPAPAPVGALDLVFILAPLKDLPGSLRIRGETVYNYALHKTAAPEAIVEDALALIKEAESFGFGPYKDIKKALKD